MTPATLEQNYTTQKTIYTRWGKTEGMMPVVFPHFRLIAVQTVMDAVKALTVCRATSIISVRFASPPTHA